MIRGCTYLNGLLAAFVLRLKYQDINQARDAKLVREFSEKDMSLLNDKAPNLISSSSQAADHLK